MNAMPVLPLLSYRKTWEAEFDTAEARFNKLKARVTAASFAFLPEHEQLRLHAEYTRVGASLGTIFEMQFSTTDAYRDWALDMLGVTLGWKPAAGFEMPSGLPIVEILRRLNETREMRPSSPDETASLAWQSKVTGILSKSQSREIEALAYALHRIGGDRLGMRSADFSHRGDR
jgi:hypothetical protein